METIFKLLLGMGFIVLFAYLVFQINEQATSETFVRLTANLEEVRAGNAVIAKKNDLLKTKIEALRHDPRAIERKVRDELGLVRPDEIVVFFRNPDGSAKEWGNPGERLVEYKPEPLAPIEDTQGPEPSEDEKNLLLIPNEGDEE